MIHSPLLMLVLLVMEIKSSPSSSSSSSSLSSSCSVFPYYKEFRNTSSLFDISWEEYTQIVYSEKAYVDPLDLNFIYKRSSINVDTTQSKRSGMEPDTDILGIYATNYRKFREMPSFPNHSWIEVTRSPANCISYYHGNGVTEFHEGANSTGFPTYPSYHDDKLVPYGCWFSVAKGTGVFVNTGRSIVVESRKQLHAIFGVPCTSQDEKHYPNFCDEGDKYYCTHTLARGFDSIQFHEFVPPARTVPSILICSGGCEEVRVTNSCVPLETRTGINATLPCSCDPSLPVINCGTAVATNESCIQSTIPNMDDQLRPRTCILHELENNGPPKTGNFSIVFTSDMHGRLHNLPRVVSAVKHLRQKQPVLMLDAGDVTFGSAFTAQLGATAVMEAMVMAGYAAITPGNHDTLKAFPSNIPLVAVNLNSKIVQKSVVLNVQGVGIGEGKGWKVGVIGLSHSEHADVHAWARLIIDEALCLRKQGVTIVVLLSHGGITTDKQLVKVLRGYVDVILGGHSHVEVSCKGKWHSDDMVVLHSGYHGENYGIVNVEVASDGLAISTNVIPLHATMEADAELETWYRKKYKTLNVSTEVLYHFEPSVKTRQSCRSMPCDTGMLINAAVRQYLNCSNEIVGLFESGSIRGRFVGNITEGDITRVLPWVNKMVVLSIPGPVLVDMLLYSNASIESGAYLQVMGWGSHSHDVATCSFCPSEINLKAISSNRNYSIVVTDWLADGGDGYSKYIEQSTVLQVTNHSIQDIARSFFKSAPSLTCTHSAANSNSNTPNTIVSETTTTSSSSKSGGDDGSGNRVNSWWVQGFIGLTADSIGLLLSYPFLVQSVRQQAAISTALTATLTTSYSFEDPISNYCNTCSYYYNGFLLVFVARSVNSWLFWALYQYLLSHIGATIVISALAAVSNGFRAFTSSWVAGCIVAVVTNPIWVTVTRLQVHGEIPKTFHGMWSGLHLNLLLVAYPSIRQLVLETLAEFVAMTSLRELSGLYSAFLYGLLAIVATLIATVITFPLQALRTRLQAHSASTSSSSSDSSSSGLGKEMANYWAGLPAKLIYTVICEFTFFFTKRSLEILVSGFDVLRDQ